MFQRNTVIALVFAIPLCWSFQEAYGWSYTPSRWVLSSDKVVGKCEDLTGTVEVPGADGRTAEVNASGSCVFTIPETGPDGIPCAFHLTYTLPYTPTFEPVDGGYQQDWTALCNDSGLIVDGLLTCNGGGELSFKDGLGLAGPNGNSINNNLCQKVFGSANATIFSAQITYESMDASSRVVELSSTTTANCCHTDEPVPLDGTPDPATCKSGNDIQRCFGSGLNTTRAYCTYNDPFNASCGGPNAGKITTLLHADIPLEGAPDPEAVSISLDSVALGSIQLNGYPPSSTCSRKNVGGEDVIECKFERCDDEANFIIPGGSAHLTASRITTSSPIECVNQVELIQ